MENTLLTLSAITHSDASGNVTRVSYQLSSAQGVVFGADLQPDKTVTLFYEDADAEMVEYLSATGPDTQAVLSLYNTVKVLGAPGSRFPMPAPLVHAGADGGVVSGRHLTLQSPELAAHGQELLAVCMASREAQEVYVAQMEASGEKTDRKMRESFSLDDARDSYRAYR